MFPPDRRRIRPVRLTEVPLERRLLAADVCARDEAEAFARIELALAARYPSSTVYWVSRGAQAA